MNCLKFELCALYDDKMPKEHGVGAIFFKKYCEGNHENCARYMIFCELGEAFVPHNLFPNMYDIAAQIILEEKSKFKS